MSADSVQKQKNFCDKQSFEYPILSDENKDVLKSYGAWGVKKIWRMVRECFWYVDSRK